MLTRMIGRADHVRESGAVYVCEYREAEQKAMRWTRTSEGQRLSALNPKTSVGLEVNWTRASRRRQNPSIRFATQEAAPQRERLLGSANKLSLRPEERPSVQAASRRPSQVPL